ncbi:phenol hydroxylase [Marinobacterium aestuarii]|uniref:Phenol hydroxylase n=2 Tax=Marinobacterium aestuarii TaxID=1821621 RepID=A0A1A9EYE3_9GAMM|nr:phenol hydroxylase [Marinobacterium aestuarii]
MSRLPSQEPVGMRPDTFNRMTKYVRVRSQPGDRFVEFDFAIGDPTLFVELVMPVTAFERFCRAQGAVAMTAAQTAEVDAQMEKWRYGEGTLMAQNQNRSANNNNSELGN